MEEHDREQLAALGEQEGDVVDVREARVPEGAGEGAGERDEEEGPEDAARGDDGRDGVSARRAGVEVDGSRRRGEERLDRVQEHRVLEHLGRARCAVGRRREFLLEVSPGEAAKVKK